MLKAAPVPTSNIYTAAQVLAQYIYMYIYIHKYL